MTNEHSSEEEGGLTPEEILNAEQFDESSEDDEVDIVTQLQSEVASLKDQLLRSVAESQNIRRRADKERADASAYAVTAFARDMLNVSDNLKRALDSQPEDVADDMKAFVEGVDLTGRELLNVMERYGITKVEPEVGEKFDHKFHQAMFEVPTQDQAPGTIMQVVATGYTIKDRLLRPAMVGVAKGEAKALDTEA